MKPQPNLWRRGRALRLVAAPLLACVLSVAAAQDESQWRTFIDQVAEGTGQAVEAAIGELLPPGVDDVAAALMESPDIVKTGLQLWLQGKMRDAALAEDWNRLDRYQAFHSCLATGDCGRVQQLTATAPAGPGQPGSPAAPPAPVQAVGTAPRSVIILLDASGSMADPSLEDPAKTWMQLSKEKALQSLRQLPAGSEMALIVFYDCGNIAVAQPFTTDIAAVERALGPVQPTGDTPLAAALAFAQQYGTNSAAPQIDLVLLTDGEETCQGNPVEAAGNLNR